VAGLKHQPAALVLSRQPLPTIDREKYASAAGVAKGAYVLADPANGKKPQVILIGTGSELALAMQGYEQLTKEGIAARVVSMPSWELFESQDKAYQDSVFPAEVPARVAIEQASTMGWERYTGRLGAVIGMHTFGASAPMKDLLTKFGFTPEKVVEIAKQQIANHQHPKAVNDSAR
jgi:transketolase